MRDNVWNVCMVASSPARAASEVDTLGLDIQEEFDAVQLNFQFLVYRLVDSTAPPFLARVIFTRVIRPLQTSEKFPSTPCENPVSYRQSYQTHDTIVKRILEMLSSALQARQGIRVVIPVYCLRSRVVLGIPRGNSREFRGFDAVEFACIILAAPCDSLFEKFVKQLRQKLWNVGEYRGSFCVN